MTKTKQAEIQIRKLGFVLEFVRSPRGNTIAVAEKEGKRYYETTVIKLAKIVSEI